MESEVRASIDLHQAVLRYAEVEQYGSRHRLLRLGSCDFAFDASEEIFRADEPEYLDTMTEALGDVFAGSVASELNVLLHPPACYSFFAPVAVEVEEAQRKERLQQEASMLIQGQAEDELYLADTPLYEETLDDEQVTWFHVLGIKQAIYERISRLMKVLPQAACRPKLSMHAVAEAVAALRNRQPVPDPDDEPSADASGYTLSIGWYPTHIEYTLCREKEWYFSHHTPAGSPTDCAYFSVTLLNRLELLPRVVERIYLYGSEVEVSQFRLLQSIFGIEPQRLNVMHVVDLETENFTASFDAEAYAPSVGAVL